MIGDQATDEAPSVSRNPDDASESQKAVSKKTGFRKKVKNSHKLHKKTSGGGLCGSPPEEIITVPLGGRYKGRGSGFARKKGDKVISYTCDQGFNYKPGGE